MGNFIDVSIKERVDGAPGVIADEEFDIIMDVDKVTLFNSSNETPNITFVRLVCGATLCVNLSPENFKKRLIEAGSKIFETVKPPKKVAQPVKTPPTKKKK